MEWLLDVDPHSGAVETFSYDEANDTFTVARRGDVEPVIERNKRLLTHDRPRSAKGDADMRHVASVPIEVAYVWLQKYGVRAWDRNHWPAVKRLLNSSEWRYLRTSEIYL